MALYRYSKNSDENGGEKLPAPGDDVNVKPMKMSEKIEQLKKELETETDEERAAREKGYEDIVNAFQCAPGGGPAYGSGNNQNMPPEVKYGPQGGRYTEDVTEDGRPYRRYF